MMGALFAVCICGSSGFLAHPVYNDACKHCNAVNVRVCRIPWFTVRALKVCWMVDRMWSVLDEVDGACWWPAEEVVRRRARAAVQLVARGRVPTAVERRAKMTSRKTQRHCQHQQPHLALVSVYIGHCWWSPLRHTVKFTYYYYSVFYSNLTSCCTVALSLSLCLGCHFEHSGKARQPERQSCRVRGVWGSVSPPTGVGFGAVPPPQKNVWSFVCKCFGAILQKYPILRDFDV